MPAPPLHLPEDLELDLSDPHAMDLRYPGDVRLSQTFGRQLGAVWAGGDLQLHIPLVTGTVLSQGVLQTAGEVDATRLTAREIHLSGSSIRARALSATERIVISSAAKLRVDVIIAPIIEIHPGASGRVTVIESRNDRGPTEIKGGFSLQEYDELFGDAIGFLAARGVGPLDEPTLENTIDDDVMLLPTDALEEVSPEEIEEVSPEEIEEVSPEEIEEVSPEEIEGVPEDELADVSLEAFDGAADEPDPMSAGDDEALVELIPEPLDDDAADVEDTIAPLDADGEDLEGTLIDVIEDEDAEIIEGVGRPLPPRAATPTPPPPPSKRRTPPDPITEAWYHRVDGVVENIVDTYDPYPPPPLLELQGIVESRQPEALAHGLAGVWREIFRHHRQARTPLHPKVAHCFRVLSDLVEQGPSA